MDSMNFHSLSRRELQSLCKKNKIPANMTNIAMADALTALTNVIGIEEIGQSDSTMPETPLTSRKTTARKTATKPQAVESESTQTLTRPRRATTAKKINKEEDPKDLSETTSVNETPAPKTGRRRVTGTSVCRKLDEQTQEVKEESKEERPVVHSYSTRRSSRLQSGQKITESVQKRGGRKNEAVKICALSEEETNDVPMKSNYDEVQENQGDNVKLLSPIPDGAQEDLISEDGSSSTLVSADVSSCIEEVSSANQDLISESKDGFSAEQSSEQQDMSTEVSSCFNDAHISEISVSEVTLISENKDVITLEDDVHVDQVMSPEDSKVASDELDNMDIKEESAVEVTVASSNVISPEDSKVATDESDNMDIKEESAVEVAVASPNVMSPEVPKVASDELDSMDIKEESAVEVTVASPNVSTKKVVQMREVSPLKEATNDLVKTNDQVDDMKVGSIDRSEIENAIEYGLKFSFENDFSDSEASPFEFDTMKEAMECISNLEISNQVEATSRVEASIECEKFFVSEMQECEATDLPVLKSTDATVSSPTEVASKVNQVKLDDSVSVEQLEYQKVDSVKCDSTADEECVKVDPLLDDASTDEEDSDNESDDSDESDGDDETVDGDESESEDEDETVDEDESDDNVDDILESPIAGVINIQNPVTPVKSPSAKKIATTPNSKMMIKVLEDTEESNKSGKVSLKSNSKQLTPPGVAEQKENNDNNKGESTAQKSLRKKSIRQLKKILKEKQQVTKMFNDLKITSDGNETTGKEDLQQVEKRAPLQKLNDNCLLGEEGK